MQLQIRKGTPEDIDEVSLLYDKLNDYLESHINYPGWKNQLDYDEIFVLYTFAVHPQFIRLGIGKTMMRFVLAYASKMNMKAVRLDVYEKNIPAIHLYEEFGFQYIDTVDLGYSDYGLDRFRLYQRLL